MGNALRGLAFIVQRLFGVSMVRESVRPGEAWDVSSGAAAWLRHSSPSFSSSSSSSSSRLFKYRLEHETEGDLGIIYFDLFARPGKYHGAAHYVIRCGKQCHEYDGAFEATMGVPGSHAAAAASSTSAAASGSGSRGGAVHQLPIVALVTNFQPSSSSAGRDGQFGLLGSLLGSRAASSSSSSSSATARGNSVAALEEETSSLLPREVETLFHEFGHALHSMLSRTQFQHLHGERRSKA